MKLFLKLAVALAAVPLFLLSDPLVVNANTYRIEEYIVEVDIDTDSTFVVTETQKRRYNGIAHAVTRGLKLEDSNNLKRCKENSNLQCGGFYFVNTLGFTGDGRELRYADEAEYDYDSEGRVITPADTYVSYDYSSGGNNYKHWQWVFSENGRNFNNELLEFEIIYRIYGGLAYFPEEDYDLFYWNVFPEEFDQPVDEAMVYINLPESLSINNDNFKVLSDVKYEIIEDGSQGRIVIRPLNLSRDKNFTVLLKIPHGVVQEYGSFIINSRPDPVNMTLDDISLGEIDNELKGVPPGNHTLSFSAKNYYPQSLEVDLEPGETREININLERTLWGTALFYLLIAANALGVAMIPGVMVGVLLLWKRKGKDLGEKKTPIPIYSPPEDIKPYLLGGLKDEKMDPVDITSTIIDLAYRGYITIKEFKSKEIFGIKLGGKDFELIKNKDKDFSKLNKFEDELVDDVFLGMDMVKVSALRNRFYKHVKTLQDIAYDDLVSKGYFSKSPDKIRSKYQGIGIALLLIGIVMFIFPLAIGFYYLITLSIAALTAGILLIIVANFMPAKTESGSEVYWKVKGFKMFMETAEKHRMQNLTPETFEKYLSYAIVFGVEKQWAEKFKDIYKGMPDWYQSDSTTFNTVLLANSLNTFNTTTVSALTTSPSSSGTSSFGGGWSGGGGFSGGFSGGGGGGGSTGGW